MTHLIGVSLDCGLTTLAVIVLLRFYFKPEAKRLYKKKWVLFGCICGFGLFLSQAREVVVVYRDYSKTKAAEDRLRDDLEESVLVSNTLAAADFVYRSPKGYSILIPDGYAYTHVTPDPCSLIAFKGEVGLVVGRCPPRSYPLDYYVQGLCQEFKRGNPTMSFSARGAFTDGKMSAIRFTCQFVKAHVARTALVMVFRKDARTNVFYVMSECPDTSFAENRRSFERIIRSVTVE